MRVEIMKSECLSVEADGSVVRMVLLKDEEDGSRFVFDICEASASAAPRFFANHVTGLVEPADIEWPDVNFGRAKSVLGKMRKLVERVTS